MYPSLGVIFHQGYNALSFCSEETKILVGLAQNKQQNPVSVDGNSCVFPAWNDLSLACNATAVHQASKKSPPLFREDIPCSDQGAQNYKT